MNDLSSAVTIDRLSGTFEIDVNYTIDGYYDPETGEYFGDTNWYAVVTAPDGSNGWAGSNYGPESNTAQIVQGLPDGDTPTVYALDVYAQNTFSGQSVTQHFNIFAGAYATPGLTYAGTSGRDIAIGGYGNDVLHGLDDNDFLDGGGGDDTLDGGAGDDQLTGGDGANLMTGGDGDDAYFVSSASDTVTEQLNQGWDTVNATVSFVLGDNIERLQLLDQGYFIDGTGNAIDNTIIGNSLANHLSGLDGNDDLHGGNGDDTIDGGAGNDLLDSGGGADDMTGGTGDDLYMVESAGDQVHELPGEGTDTVQVTDIASYTLGADVENLTKLFTGTFHGTGNELANHLIGGTGDDTLDGLGGDDTVDGYAGNDTVDGGAGNDVLKGGIGSDTLIGGIGDDRFYVDNAADVVTENAGEGSDWVLARSSYVLTAGAEIEKLTTIDSAGTAAINLTGNELANTILGNAGNNVLSGGAGNDALAGGNGNDTLRGNQGNDALDGGAGDDTLDGGLDSDTASYVSAISGVTVDLRVTAAQNTLGAGTDTLANVENLSGSLYGDVLTGNSVDNVLTGLSGNDTLIGNFGNDTLYGNQNDDTLDGGMGNDTLDGGIGIDTATYGSALAGVTVDLRIAVAQNTGGAGSDTLANIENISGSGFADTLAGNSLDNVLAGLAGNDTLVGNFGNDTLAGGTGNDTLSGGVGADRFVFDSPLDAVVNVDAIVGFVAVDDTIALKQAVFAAAGAVGALAASAFYTGSAAHDADDRIVYDSASGNIYYDADGNGAGAQTLFAQVTPGLALTEADFLIVA